MAGCLCLRVGQGDGWWDWNREQMLETGEFAAHCRFSQM